MPKRTHGLPDIGLLLADGFCEETARSLYAQGEEIVIFVMMQLAALALKTHEVNGVHPSEPSGSIALFHKEPRKKRRKKPGAKPGHPGSRRPPPENITHRVTHVAKCCPDCGGKLNKRRSTTRKRYTEDIPDDIQPEVTEHTIQAQSAGAASARAWCRTQRYFFILCKATYDVINKSRASPVAW